MERLIADWRPVNSSALDMEIRAIPGISGYAGHSAGLGKLIFWFEGGVTPAVQAAVLAALAAHNPDTLTPEQTLENQTRIDWAQMIEQAQTAVAQIDSDLTLLSGNPTNAQLMQILGRALQRQRQIIRGLLYIARRI